MGILLGHGLNLLYSACWVLAGEELEESEAADSTASPRGPNSSAIMEFKSS